MAANQGNIEEIFRQAFESHEMTVSPHVWSGIQSTLAASAATSGAATATGSTFLAKAAAVIGMSALVTAATISEVRYHQQERLIAEAETTSTTVVNAAVSTQQEVKTQRTAEPAMPETGVTVAAESEAKPRLASPSSVNPANNTPATENTEKTAEAMSPAEEPADLADTHTPMSPAENASREKPVSEESGQAADKELRRNEGKSTSSNVQAREEQLPAEQPETKETIANFTHQAKAWVSANGDGSQDYFSVQGTNVAQFHIRIWDQGKQLLFESDDINFKWYGTDLSGKTLPNRTVCFYEIQAVGTDGLPYMKRNAKGSITVFR